MEKLNIVLKRNLGKMLMLQTIQLERDTPGHGNMRLFFETISDALILEVLFNITCKLTNCNDRKMKLFGKMCDTDSIH